MCCDNSVKYVSRVIMLPKVQLIVECIYVYMGQTLANKHTIICLQ